MYSQADLSIELGQLLDGFAGAIDYARTADWAYKTYLRHVGDIDPGAKELLIRLGTMSMGAEFELPEPELRGLAESSR
jgi:hypothetical protein